MIPPDQLAAYFDDALEPAQRAEVERALEAHPAAWQDMLDQRRLDRLLRVALAPVTRKARLKASVLAAVDDLARAAPCRCPGRRPPVGAPSHPRATLSPLGPGGGIGVTGWRLCSPASPCPGWLRPPWPRSPCSPPSCSSWALRSPGRSSSANSPPSSASRPCIAATADRLASLDPPPPFTSATASKPGTRIASRSGFSTAQPCGWVSTPPSLFPRHRRRDGAPGSRVRRPPRRRCDLPKSGCCAGRCGPGFRPRPTRLRTRSTPKPPPPSRAAPSSASGCDLSPTLLLLPHPPFATILTVKEGIVDFTNAHGSVRATAMTESTARMEATPTEPRRLETLQVVQLSRGLQWSILSASLDWPEAADRLALGGGWAGFTVSDTPEPGGAGRAIRVGQVHRNGPAAAVGLLAGDIVLALDGQRVTEASQVSRLILLRPGQPVELTVRRDETELTLSLTPRQRPPVLPGPDLSGEQARAVSEWTRTWIDRGLDSGEPGEGVKQAKDAPVRAAVGNDSGVLQEADNALGPAIRAYGRAVGLAPRVALYRFNLGLALRKIGSLERAAEELAAAVALAPGTAEALKRLAEVHSLLDANDLALEQVEAAFRADPADHGLLELKAQVLSKLGRDREATEAARAAVAMAPDCAVAHGILGRALLQEGYVAESETSYRRALELNPFDAMCHLNLGSVLKQRGQRASAEQSYRRAIELRPEFVLAHRGLAALLAGGRRWTEANEVLGRAAALAPDDAEVLRELGLLALHQGQPDNAEAWFRRALERVPHDVKSLAALGQVTAMRGDLAGAERWLRQACALAPGDSGVHNDLGEVFRLGGKLDEAIECYRRAIALDPDSLGAQNNLAIVHSMRGEHAEAERILRNLVERASNDPRVNPLNFIANLALACGHQGKLVEAEQFHRQALALAPNDPGLSNALAWFLAEHRLHLDEALGLARRAVEMAPRDPTFLDTLGWVHFQRGEFEEAEGFLQRALDLAGDGPSAAGIREHLQQLQQTRATDPNQSSSNPTTNTSLP